MTESAYFASAAQQDCFNDLDVEQYEVIASLDPDTCPLCGALDGKVFKMSDYQVGLTAPPFHPWCRCCTAPYYEDRKDMGERFARDPVTGESYQVPGNMTYEQWKAKQDELHGAGTVDLQHKKSYNHSKDKAQWESYKAILGKNAPASLDDFQALKYDDPTRYDELAGLYSYRVRVPEATKADYKAYKAVKATGAPGTVRVPAKPIEVEELIFKDTHGTHHGCTLEDAKDYIRQAKCSITRKRWDGYHTNYYSFEGATYMDDESGKINTAFSKSDFDPKTKEIMEVFE